MRGPTCDACGRPPAQWRQSGAFACDECAMPHDPPAGEWQALAYALRNLADAIRTEALEPAITKADELLARWPWLYRKLGGR